MLSSALGALSDRIDSKFLTAYVLPAFIAVLGGLGILALLAGAEQMDSWVYGLSSVEQSLGVLIFIISMLMLAFLLRALTRPIAYLFAGNALPRSVAAWSTRGQTRNRSRTERRASDQVATQLYPRDAGEMQPTLFGNVLAAASDYPRAVYSMDGLLWWPRLTPLLPSHFEDLLAGTQAPMMGVLNLSVVFAALALVGFVVLGFIDAQWALALVILLAGLLVARLCYQAAISQAMALSSLMRVAFDLYRHEILSQMGLSAPADLTAERALWQQMTEELRSGIAPPDSAAGVPEPPT